MNVIFGVAGDDAAGFQNIAAEYLQKEFGAAPVVSKFSNSLLGSVSDGGGVAGIANDQDLTLAFLGTIFPPLVGWEEGSSPLDNPNETAEYLLARYRSETENFLDGVNGQYTVAIHCSKSGKLLFMSDPLGGRSFYVYRNNILLVPDSARYLHRTTGSP